MKAHLRIGRIAAMLALVLAAGLPALAGGDWNDKGIDWQPYDKGLALAKKTNKPVCLIFYTEWCPHCTSYSSVFHDPKVIAESKKFVMIRLDKDKNEELSKANAPDGEYIPRTYFLSADGKMNPAIHAPRDKFVYFYDEKAPESILAGMEEALKTLAAPPPAAPAPASAPTPPKSESSGR